MTKINSGNQASVLGIFRFFNLFCLVDDMTGSDRKRLAVVRSQVHGAVRAHRVRRSRAVPGLHATLGLHLATATSET